MKKIHSSDLFPKWIAENKMDRIRINSLKKPQERLF